MLENVAFRWYALASTIVALQLLGLAVLTGSFRVKNAQYVNPEDARFGKSPPAEAEHPMVLRVKRAHANLLENAVPFFVVGALYVATGGSDKGCEVYFGTFVTARLLHSIFYLRGLQPWRTLSFAVGALAVTGMAVHVFRTIF